MVKNECDLILALTPDGLILIISSHANESVIVLGCNPRNARVVLYLGGLGYSDLIMMLAQVCPAAQKTSLCCSLDSCTYAGS